MTSKNETNEEKLQLMAELLPKLVDLAAKHVLGNGFNQELYTPSEAANLLRKSIPTLARWRAAGEGPAYQTDKSTKNSRFVLYTKSALLEYVFSNPEEYPHYNRQEITKILQDVVPEIQNKLRKFKSK